MSENNNINNTFVDNNGVSHVKSEEYEIDPTTGQSTMTEHGYSKMMQELGVEGEELENELKKFRIKREDSRK